MLTTTMLSPYLSCPTLEGVGYKVQIAAIGDRSPLVSGVKVQAGVGTRASDPTSREAGSRLFHAKARADPCPPPSSPLLPPPSWSATPLHRPRGGSWRQHRRRRRRSSCPQRARPPASAAPAPSSPSGGARSPGPAGGLSRPALGSGAGGCWGGRRGRGRRDTGAAARVTSCAPGKLPGCLVRFAGWGFGRGRDGAGDARVCLLCAPRTPCASGPRPAGLVPALIARGRGQALRSLGAAASGELLEAGRATSF